LGGGVALPKTKWRQTFTRKLKIWLFLSPRWYKEKRGKNDELFMTRHFFFFYYTTSRVYLLAGQRGTHIYIYIVGGYRRSWMKFPPRRL
jgi:hypothetical protein